MSTDTRPICEIVDEWIAEHISELPSSFEALHQYPPEYRRRIYGTLSQAVRRQLWIDHLDRVLTRDSGYLSAGQRQLIVDVARDLRAGGLLGDRFASDRELLSERIIAAFDRSRVVDSFTLEGASSVPWDRQAWVVRGHHFFRNAIARANDLSGPLYAQTFDCNCNSDQYCWLIGMTCCDHDDFYPGCEWKVGCGIFGEDTCEGMCVYPEDCTG